MARKESEEQRIAERFDLESRQQDPHFVAKCREELADEKTLVPWGLRCVNCGHVVVETTPDSLVGSLGVDMEAFEESLPLESEDEGVA